MILDTVKQGHAAVAGDRGDQLLQACFDFRIRSDLRLPELIAAAPGDTSPVVTVRLGAERPMEDAPGGLELVGEGVARLTIPTVGRFTVSHGTDILVEPAPGASARNTRLFVLGSALGILCHQRGLVPLHANAVVVNGRAFAFAGASGAGKSTLAAHFARTGLTVLSDDVVAVSLDEVGRAWAWPGVARLKLWRDASDALGQDIAGLDRAVDGVEKYHHPLARPPHAGAVPLDGLYLLERAEPDAPAAITRLRGGGALAAVVSHTYRGAYIPVLGLSATHFRRCAAIAATIEVHTATREWGYDVFEAEAARLLDHIEGSGGDRTA